jgi:prepilin-type N-terminal cleavage/methylation domain-containing protein
MIANTTAARSYKRSTTHSLRAQRGFTLLEITVAVGIVAIFVASLTAAPMLMGYLTGKKEGESMAQTIACVRVSQTDPTFAGLTLADVSNRGCFPANATTNKGTANATATNGFGVAYTVAVVNIVGVNDGFQITSGGFNEASCKSAVNHVSSMATSISVTPAGGNATVVKALGGNLNVTNTAIACNSNNNSIVVQSNKAGA